MRFRKDIKKRLVNAFKSPFTIIGMIIMGVLIILAIFAQEISGFSLTEAALGYYLHPFAPPSSEHLLGTTALGRDVFARILYGLRNALIFGLIVIIPALTFSSVLGVLSSLHRYANKAIEICLLGLIIVTFSILILFFIGVFGRSTFALIIILGILLIPILTRIIAYVPFDKRNIKTSFQKLVIYLPLIYGTVILIYSAIGFIGFGDPTRVALGADINRARDMLYSAPWASLWPGVFMFFLVVGPFLLFIGLNSTFMDQLESLRISENVNIIKK